MCLNVCCYELKIDYYVWDDIYKPHCNHKEKKLVVNTVNTHKTR